MNTLATIFASAGQRAQFEYDKKISEGGSVDEAIEEAKAEFYYRLFSWFLNPNLSKWEVSDPKPTQR